VGNAASASSPLKLPILFEALEKRNYFGARHNDNEFMVEIEFFFVESKEHSI
jgi:hypothetical protein